VQGNNWGWTNGPFDTTFVTEVDATLWRGAAHCDTSAGTDVGNFHINIDGANVEMTFTLNPGFTLSKVYSHVGEEKLPRKNPSTYTVSPGQFGFKDENAGGVTTYTHKISVDPGCSVYVAAHASICGYGY
jgi:hypothetical protein